MTCGTAWFEVASVMSNGSPKQRMPLCGNRSMACGALCSVRAGAKRRKVYRVGRDANSAIKRMMKTDDETRPGPMSRAAAIQ
jgi:hypothetical protein